MKLINLNIILVSIIVILSASCQTGIYKEEIMLLSQKSTDSLDYAHLMIFRDSTFQYVSIRKLKENVFSGKAVITEDTIYLTYNDTVPNVGHKAHYTKDYIEFVQADNVKLEIKLNRFPPSRE